MGLGGGKALFANWVVAGYRDIRDVKCSEITAEQQLRIHRVTGFGEPPMRALAEQMIACLGEIGPVLMYTSYEKTVMNRLIAMFPDLAELRSVIVNRIWYLHALVKVHYYNPAILGSWSIKAVLPAMVPEMS
jgi:hypothetical protein